MAITKNLIVTSGSVGSGDNKAFIRIGDLTPTSTNATSSALEFLQLIGQTGQYYFDTAGTTSAFRIRHNTITNQLIFQGRSGSIVASPLMVLDGNTTSGFQINDGVLSLGSFDTASISYQFGSQVKFDRGISTSGLLYARQKIVTDGGFKASKKSIFREIEAKSIKLENLWELYYPVVQNGTLVPGLIRAGVDSIIIDGSLLAPVDISASAITVSGITVSYINGTASSQFGSGALTTTVSIAQGGTGTGSAAYANGNFIKYTSSPRSQFTNSGYNADSFALSGHDHDDRYPINSKQITINGTPNQVILLVPNESQALDSDLIWTLGTPQDIATISSPRFLGITASTGFTSSTGYLSIGGDITSSNGYIRNNLGIGLASPTDLLHIQTKLPNQGISIYNQAKTGYLKFNSNAGDPGFSPILIGKPVGDYPFSVLGIKSDTAVDGTAVQSFVVSNNANNSPIGPTQVAFKFINFNQDLITIDGAGNTTVGGNLYATKLSATQLTSSVTTGIQPFSVSSTTMVKNLNSQFINGTSSSQLSLASHDHNSQYVSKSQPITISGTINQISVNNASQSFTGSPSWILSLPQNIHTGANPLFAGLTSSATIKTIAIVATGSPIHPSGIGYYTYMYYNPADSVGRLLAWDGVSTYRDIAIGDWNAGDPNIMLKVGGNVGIGKGTPTARLDVNGNIRANQITLSALSNTYLLKTTTGGAIIDSNITDNGTIITFGVNALASGYIHSVTGYSSSAGYLKIGGTSNLDGNVTLGLLPTHNAIAYGKFTASAGISTSTLLATGVITSQMTSPTAPFSLASTGLNTNLNADMVDNVHIGTPTQWGIPYYSTSALLASTANLIGIIQGRSGAAPTALTGVANRVARWVDAYTIAGSLNLLDDGTKITTSVKFTASAGISSSTLDVGSSAIIVNSSGTTANQTITVTGSKKITFTGSAGTASISYSNGKLKIDGGSSWKTQYAMTGTYSALTEYTIQTSSANQTVDYFPYLSVYLNGQLLMQSGSSIADWDYTSGSSNDKIKFKYKIPAEGVYLTYMYNGGIV